MTCEHIHPGWHGARTGLAALAFIALLALAACSGPAGTDADVDVAAATPAAADIPGPPTDAGTAPQPLPLPLQDFIVAFHKASLAAGHAPDGRYQFPAIWLYAPGGRLHSQIDDDAGLARLQQDFGSLDPSGTRPGTLSLDDVLAIVTEAGATATIPASTERWAAIVLLDASDCGSMSCGPYADTVDQLRLAHPHALDVIRVALVK
ncbi:hypothetical protein WCE34_08230 [Luteimonas sp. MJ204]|uniref:hypothetical protein n=1 Tax=Luteimonas sp. MJ145 TaxID=3129234 RepID=UPI0031BB98BD